MKTHWSDLTEEEQAQFGDGCGALAKGLKVPDFIFKASCQQHDFNYLRGGWPWHKVQADWWFYRAMLKDAFLYPWLQAFIYSCLATIYFLTVLIVSWPFFTYGRWRSKEEILLVDAHHTQLAALRKRLGVLK